MNTFAVSFLPLAAMSPVLEGLLVFLVLAGIVVLVLGAWRLWLDIEDALEARRRPRSAASARATPVSAAPAGLPATTASPAVSTPAAPPVAPRPVEVAPAAPIAPHILALISAAVFATVKRPVRIRSVRLVTQHAGGADAWATLGRTAIHRSHRPRKG